MGVEKVNHPARRGMTDSADPGIQDSSEINLGAAAIDFGIETHAWRSRAIAQRAVNEDLHTCLVFSLP